MYTTKFTERSPSRSDSFFKYKSIQYFLLALVAVHPFSEEEFPETAMKTWKLLVELRMSQPLFFNFNFCLRDHLTKNKLFIIFYNGRAISSGYVQVKNMTFRMDHFLMYFLQLMYSFTAFAAYSI